jgi:hypothetical protein
LCLGCVENKYKSISQELGFTLISRGAKLKRHILNLQYNTCGCTVEQNSGNLVKKKKPVCPQCRQNKYINAAAKLDFQYIRETKKDNVFFVTLICNKDNNKLSVAPSSLLKGYVLCPKCRETYYKAMLEKKGCTLISVSTGSKKSGTKSIVTYKNKACEIFKTKSNHICKGSFAATLDGQWRDKHSTYVMRLENNGDTYCKIGTAQDPEKRLKQLKLIGNAEVFTLASFDDRFGADKLESELQREFKAFKLPKEIASTFTQAIVMSKRKGHTERVPCADGYTEWYQGNEVFDALSKRYNLEMSTNEFDKHTTGEVAGTGH